MPEKNIDRVALASVIIGLLSFFLSFLAVRPNRIVAGTPLYASQALDVLEFGTLVVLWLTAAVVSIFLGSRQIKSIIQAVIGNLILISLFYFIGSAAAFASAAGTPSTRVSVGTGTWIMLFAVQVLIISSTSKISYSATRFTLSLTGLAIVTLMTAMGHLNEISLLKEYTIRQGRFLFEFSQHLILSGSAVGVAVIAGVPLGIWAFRSTILEKPIFLVVNGIQTIPSLALFGIMIVPLSVLSQRFGILRELGIRGIGWAPALIALALYALLPIARNTYTSLKVIDPAIIEAGKGMGMNRIQLLLSIQVPIATPVILSGIRTSLVQAVGNTTVAALIGAGGFGVFVFQGLGQAVPDLILLGAVPVILLAIVTDKLFDFFIQLISPKGIVRVEQV